MISKEKPWMKYYPEEAKHLSIPKLSLNDYFKNRTKDDDIAIEYYGNNIDWKTFWEKVDLVTNALVNIGIKEGDQIPVFLQAVPEYLYLLFATERLGACIICRDGTIEENLYAIVNANAKTIFVHDFLDNDDAIKMREAGVKNIIAISPSESAKSIPDYVQKNIDTLYNNSIEEYIPWKKFINVEVKDIPCRFNINSPLLKAYTTGTTGTSKQVIHNAQTILGVLHPMNLYSFETPFKFRTLHTILPPSLVAGTIAMLLSPLCSGKILVLDPFVNVNDIDLSLMLYKPNTWTMIPMFVDVILNSDRIPEDFDLSYFVGTGCGAEFINNKKLRQIKKFFEDHKCNGLFTTGYGMSEVGSACTLPLGRETFENFCYGVPLPLATISIFKESTDEELGYNELGEVCVSGPGVMMGYDNEEVTKQCLFKHSDGQVWFHSGDIGYMTEDGLLYVLNRNYIKHVSGGNLFVSVMENKIVDVKGIKDCFFITKPDTEHKGFYVSKLFLIPEENANIDDIIKEIKVKLDDYEYPQEIEILKERPFFHFKTARKLLS